MDETRRNLIKGMFTSGALLALGIPSITSAASINQPNTGKIRHCQLLLLGNNTPINEAFISGANAAWGTYTDNRQGMLPIVKLRNELLTNPFKVAELLQQSHPVRWIAMMDNASAAIFNELIRNIEGHLLSLGLHTFSSDDTPLPLRHVWTTTSSLNSAGGLLASTLMQNQHNFSIVEHFLGTSTSEGAMTVSPISGFTSYRLTEQQTTHLHCARVSPAEACKLLDWQGAEKWEAPYKAASDTTTTAQPQFDNWVEATGHVLVATALGGGTSHESCTRRAFVHKSGQHDQNIQRLSGTHFVSFLLDV